MNPEDIKAIFGMQPEAAVAYLRQKGVMVSWDWQDETFAKPPQILYIPHTQSKECRGFAS